MSSGRNPSLNPDLFSMAQPSPDASAPLASDPNLSQLTNEPAERPLYALPTNLPSALNRLDDDQLDRLLSAVIAEQQRRGKKLPVTGPSRKQRTKEFAPRLAQGKLNAVRAAFKAGVKPSRIAREFGVSQSDVSKALAGDDIKK
jgi:hypothetical protein